MIKNLFATIGLIIVLIFAGLAYLGTNIISVQDEHTPFAEQFMHDFSEKWQISDVEARLSDSFIEQMKSDDGRYLLQTLKSMGQFQSLSSLIASEYNSTSTGTTVTLNFTADFDKGKAVINLHLIETDDNVQINGLYITPLEQEPLPREQMI